MDLGEVPMMGTPWRSRSAARFFLIADVEDVFEGEGFEEEFVGGVVIGGDGLGVGVDHDGLVAEFLECEGGVDAAVVELDALADSVRSAAEDDDFLFVGRACFVFVAVGGVEVGGVGFEFGGAGIDEAVGGDDAFGFAFGADVVFVDAACFGELAVGEAEFFGA
jgi:hypothetical protein